MMKEPDEIDNGFYLHEKFGVVPKGWEVKSIGECFDFFPTASYSRSQLSDYGDCGYVHYGDIHTKFNRFLDLDRDELPYVSSEMAAKYTKVNDGDLIISDASEDYDGVGKAVEVINTEEKCLISGLHTLHLRPKKNSFITGFSGYLLNHNKVRLSILRSATGIKVYSVSKSELKRILLPKPSRPEQIAITTIISKVDEAIEATQNSVKAAENLKKSLMQNLLTGKLNHDGTWRTENDFYEDEKFGKVPNGWACSRFKDFAVLQRGKDLTDKEVIQGEYPVVKSNGVQIHHNEYFVEPPGVVTGRSGTIGKAFFIEERFWAHNTALYVKDFKKNHPKYIYYLILRMDFRQYYAGTTVPTLNRNDIHRLKIAIPNSYYEQEKIVERLDATQKIIEKRQTKIRTLQRLKKSLMQHLLTGKVRLPQEVIERFLKEEKEVVNA